ncbi:enoyl-CoA hydratase/isomerase family protein [Methylosinus sp. H3A]|uniref:enoyl-CoA hydratase-related protein n=1 Tax=Methylosinus sp. H3A TaxID=2785786 RepID=UPI0018C2A59A|nr:enoyl-CoA hydratase-related protein [Methylosinus sp. H3A]MBG0807888.1 enoyl-CoA hydratase/isomerase family protein [Methylosinus sp. H3A]
MTQPVHVTRSTTRNGSVIGELRLARPERGNALDEAMLDAIAKGCAELASDGALRAVLLTAEGRHFCAGADLAWMRRAAELSDDENILDAERLDAALGALAGLPAPLVAKAQGCAYGGGIGLLCCADVVLAETGATFRFSEPLLGLVPAVISPYVVRAIGLRRTRRRFLAAEAFDAVQALEDGLVHEVLDAAALEARTRALLDSIASCGPVALRECKALLDRLQARDNLGAETIANRRLIARLRTTSEAHEGMAAFLGRRPPAWLAAPAATD